VLSWTSRSKAAALAVLNDSSLVDVVLHAFGIVRDFVVAADANVGGFRRCRSTILETEETFVAGTRHGLTAAAFCRSSDKLWKCGGHLGTILF
jgi:hypothetical protein